MRKQKSWTLIMKVLCNQYYIYTAKLHMPSRRHRQKMKICINSVIRHFQDFLFHTFIPIQLANLLSQIRLANDSCKETSAAFPWQNSLPQKIIFWEKQVHREMLFHHKVVQKGKKRPRQDMLHSHKVSRWNFQNGKNILYLPRYYLI